ncbi:hypothetical protein [Pseudoalteromonas 'SMAR']|uniref:hypothetical protein n=1 Tax=Pseudoalteromonas 'SMAR' TaxID=3416908 RepID=UPI003AF28070
MSLLTEPVESCEVQVIDGKPAVTCQCCKHQERATQPGVTKAMWLHAANHIGWRHVKSEAFDIDVVCPECVSAFNNPIKKPLMPNKRVTA